MDEFDAVDEIIMDEDLSATSAYAIAHVEKEEVYASLPQIFTPSGRVRKNPNYDASRSQKSAIERAMIVTNLTNKMERDPSGEAVLVLNAGHLKLSRELSAFFTKEFLWVDMAVKGWDFYFTK